VQADLKFHPALIVQLAHWPGGFFKINRGSHRKTNRHCQLLETTHTALVSPELVDEEITCLNHLPPYSKNH
jgi:hypothetical protein